MTEGTGLGAPGRGGLVRRRRRGRVLGVFGTVVLVLVTVTVVAGLQGGAGPLGALGRTESSLPVLTWRPTADPLVIDVGLRLDKGLCVGEAIWVRGIVRDNRLEVDARLQGPRSRDCPQGVPVQGYTWEPLPLEAPLSATTVVVSLPGRTPVPRSDPATTPGSE